MSTPKSRSAPPKKPSLLPKQERAYRAPVAIPHETNYPTLDNVPVRLNPNIDPRNQLTQVSIKVMGESLTEPSHDWGVWLVALVALVFGGAMAWLVLVSGNSEEAEPERAFPLASGARTWSEPNSGSSAVQPQSVVSPRPTASFGLIHARPRHPSETRQSSGVLKAPPGISSAPAPSP